MKPAQPRRSPVPDLAAMAVVLAALAAALAAGTADAQAPSPHTNTSAGGPLRPGVYGRIKLGSAPPPPVIHSQPVIAHSTLVHAGARPVYLYVPPGQARKWQRHCHKWQACDQPVLFVRMDDSPSRLGKWKDRAEERTASAGGWAALFAWRGEE